MSIEDKAKEAIGKIQNQIIEIGEIAHGASQDHDYDIANERIKRWKSRTVKILSEKVSFNEGEKFDKRQLGSLPFDPLERITAIINYDIAFLQSIIEELDKHPEDYFDGQQPLEEKVKKMTTPKSTSEKTVFVVHGRNEKLRESMFSFLRAIGLKPVEWSQAIKATGKASPYIGDILDVAFNQAQAIIAILSGDDEARLIKEFVVQNEKVYEKELTPQPRPNVIFEAGMAMGRNEDRTILVQVGEIRPISDIAGRHITRLDNSSQKRQELVTKLQGAGCEVDTSGTDWLSVGDFQEKYIKDNTQKPIIRWV